MTFFFETFPTPFGEFSLAVDDHAAVVGTAFGDRRALFARLGDCDLTEAKSQTQIARRQILSYFAGELHAFDLPLAARGTPFQQRVWAALCKIPRGETRSYGQLAAQLGNPAASRAIGRANATNPICLIVPCHRVIGADGSLTGFAFGADLKRRLLALERVRGFSVV